MFSGVLEPRRRNTRNPVFTPFVYHFHLPLHGSFVARFALLAPLVGFRPHHSCSSLFPFRRHERDETIEENLINKNGDPRSENYEHPDARGDGCHETAPFTGSIPPDGTTCTKAVSRQTRTRLSRTLVYPNVNAHQPGHVLHQIREP